MTKKPRGRNGGRRPLPPGEKSGQLLITIPPDDLERFRALVDDGKRSPLIVKWIRAYTIARGESDRLFAQSPTAVRLLNWMQSLPEGMRNEDLEEELQSLLVERTERDGDDNGAFWIA